MGDRTQYQRIIDAIDTAVESLAAKTKREVEINGVKYTIADTNRLMRLRRHYTTLINEATRNTRKRVEWRG